MISFLSNFIYGRLHWKIFIYCTIPEFLEWSLLLFILLTRIFFLCLLVILDKILSVLIYLKNPPLWFIYYSYIISFILILLVSADLIISCHLLLSVLVITNYFMYAFHAMKFHQSSTFVVSHYFGYTVHLFLWNSKNSLIYLLIYYWMN